VTAVDVGETGDTGTPDDDKMVDDTSYRHPLVDVDVDALDVDFN